MRRVIRSGWPSGSPAVADASVVGLGEPAASAGPKVQGGAFGAAHADTSDGRSEATDEQAAALEQGAPAHDHSGGRRT